MTLVWSSGRAARTQKTVPDRCRPHLSDYVKFICLFVYNETSTRLYPSGLSARTETAQFTITHSQIKTLYFFPREPLISSSSRVNVTEVFLHTIGVSESPWLVSNLPHPRVNKTKQHTLFRSPLPFIVSWHFLTLTSALDAQAGHPQNFRAT